MAADAGNTGGANTAGEMNVKFRADATPVKTAAQEAKAALGEVGQTGTAAGEDVAKASAESGQSLLESAEAAKQFATLLTRVIFPVAIIGSIREVFAAIEENQRKIADGANKMLEGVMSSRDRVKSLQDQLEGVSETEEKIREINKKANEEKEKANTSQGGAKAAESIREIERNREISIAQTRSLDEQTQRRKQDRRERDDGVRDQLRTASDSERIQAEGEQRLNALRDEKEDNMRRKGSVAERLYIEERIKQEKEYIKVKLEELDLAKAMATAEADHAQYRQDDLETERKRMELLREILNIEREISREKRSQQEGFGVGNVPFFGHGALSGAIGQHAISQRWSD